MKKDQHRQHRLVSNLQQHHQLHQHRHLHHHQKQNQLKHHRYYLGLLFLRHQIYCNNYRRRLTHQPHRFDFHHRQ
jgi:hypothetical protein